MAMLALADITVSVNAVYTNQCPRCFKQKRWQIPMYEQGNNQHQRTGEIESQVAYPGVYNFALLQQKIGNEKTHYAYIADDIGIFSHGLPLLPVTPAGKGQ